MSQFADVILPLPLHKYYTYRIPAELKENLSTGSRVIVPFGRKKYYTAIVIFTHNHAPADYETKEIISLLDNEPILRRPQLKFWEWITGYYFCSVGDVYKAALPSGLKLESETLVSPNPDYEENPDNRLIIRRTKQVSQNLSTRSGKRERVTQYFTRYPYSARQRGLIHYRTDKTEISS